MLCFVFDVGLDFEIQVSIDSTASLSGCCWDGTCCSSLWWISATTVTVSFCLFSAGPTLFCLVFSRTLLWGLLSWKWVAPPQSLPLEVSPFLSFSKFSSPETHPTEFSSPLLHLCWPLSCLHWHAMQPDVKCETNNNNNECKNIFRRKRKSLHELHLEIKLVLFNLWQVGSSKKTVK